MIAITNKPTQNDPTQDMTKTMGGDSEADLKILQEKLESLKRNPKKKFNYPQTAAQELGWDMDTEYNNHVPNYGQNRRLCAETAYANSYVTMTARSPFAAPRQNNAAQQGKP